MNLKSCLALCCLIGILVACQENKQIAEKESVQDIVTPAVKQRIDSVLQQFVATGDIAGVSALIYEKNREVYFNAFGKADRENNVPMTRNAIVRIFSMTKPITGVALMQLHEAGKFDLDDPLSQYLPEFAGVKVFKEVSEAGDLVLEDLQRPITVRDITRHTAGFATDRNARGLGPLLTEANPLAPNNTLSQFAEKLASVPLAFQPGTQWRYGPSVDVQAYLVEQLSGQPFDEYLREHIFGPLGMEDTGYVLSEENRSRLAASYRRSEEGLLSRVPDEDTYAFNTRQWPLTPGGWGLTATIDDYMAFARMLVNRGTFRDATVLKPETVKLMATNHLDESIAERQWLPSKGQVGFGVDFAVRLRPPATPEENNGTVGEFSWDGAASTLFWVDPEHELTAVLFVQLFPFDRIGLHKQFRDAVYGAANFSEEK